MKFTSRHMKMLERMFEDEVHGALNGGSMPFQSRSKLIQELAEEGYILPYKVTLGGRFPVTVTGWQLSHLGRFTYCATCTEEDE